MRRYGLLLSILGTFLLALPAQAGKLLFWRFESTNNRLVFTTDERVQPSAQLVPNPTRVVIDLPGITLGRPSVTQTIGGTIRTVRVGQFDSQTTRLVIELAPSYIVDPQQVKIRGLSPTQWTVELPPPERLPQNQLPPSTNSDSPQSQSSPPASNPNIQTLQTESAERVQVTRDGFYISLDRIGNNQSIKKKRVRDDQFLEFTLPGATLKAGQGTEKVPVNRYGVGEIQLEQVSSSPPEARLTLQLTQDSPEWDAVYSRLGGVVLLPRGGSGQFSESPNPGTTQGTTSSVSTPPTVAPVQTTNALIFALEMGSGDRQLLIRSDRPIQGQGRWNGQLGVYEIRIANAQLANAFRGPKLGKNSPVYQLRIRQETANTVVVLVQPAVGTQFGDLIQSNSTLLALDIKPLRAQSGASRQVNVPPPLTPYPPSRDYSPTPSRNAPKTGLLVVIDPGHGGQDPGAIGLGGLQEKNIILPISLEVSRFLEQKGIRVLMTRNSDYFVSLQGRTDMANQANADLFVSIHANSMGMGRPDISGLEVYYFGNPDLSKAIHRSILRTVDIKDRGVRRARFYVLRNSKMPSTLVEVGFVTGNEDSAKLQNPVYLREMAQAIAQGILEYLQQNRS